MNKVIKDIMSRNVVTINKDLLFTEACRLFLSIHIHHLPVLDEKGYLVGIFSTTDALYALSNLVYHKIESESDVNDLISVETIMTSHKIHTLRPDDTIQDAVDLLHRLNIHSIPIIEDGILVGIVTSHDIFQEFRSRI